MKASTRVPRFRCTECNKRFTGRARLLDHLHYHIGGGYRCGSCPSVFSSRYTLTHHVNKRHGVAVASEAADVGGGAEDGADGVGGSDYLQCALCPWKFESPRSLTMHVLSTHAPPPPPVEAVETLACTLCKKEYTSADALREHVWTHVQDDGDGDVKPRVAPAHADTGRRLGDVSLNGRLKAEAPATPPAAPAAHPAAHPCSICERSFSKANHLSNHMKAHARALCKLEAKQEKAFACDICPCRFRTKFGVLFHAPVHVLGRQYICRQCCQVYKSKHSLKYHLGDSQCGKSFVSSAYQAEGVLARRAGPKKKKAAPKLGSARRVGEGRGGVGGPYWTCSQCGKQVASAAYLEAHVRSKHQVAANTNPDPEPQAPPSCFTCPLCHKRCADARGLKIHTTVSHPSARRQINLRRKTLGNTFQRRSFGNLNPESEKIERKKLSRLMLGMFNPNSRPFACHVCPWRFKNKSHLKDHILTKHVVVKGFKCPVCAKDFALERVMKKHVLVFHSVQ